MGTVAHRKTEMGRNKKAVSDRPTKSPWLYMTERGSITVQHHHVAAVSRRASHERDGLSVGLAVQLAAQDQERRCVCVGGKAFMS